MPRYVLATTLLLLTLGACRPIPSRVDFENDRRIFRGAYEAEVDTRQATSMVSLSADASLLVMAGGKFGASTQLWDVQMETSLTLLEDAYTVGVALTPDGSLVALSFRDSLGVLETGTGARLYDLPKASANCAGCVAHTLAFSPDSTLLALFSSNGSDNEVSIFEMTTGRRTLLLAGPGGGYEEAEVRFSPDGTRLALVSQNNEPYVPGGGRSQLGRATLWALPEGQPLGSYEQATPAHDQADAHAWHDGSPIVGVAYDERLELVEVMTGSVLNVLPLARAGVTPENLYLSPDGRYAALKYRFEAKRGEVTERGSELAVWDVPNAHALYRGLTDIQPLGFSADGRYLLTHNRAGVALRDPATMAAAKVLVNGEVLPLRIEATPTYVNQSRYTIAGTVALGDAPPTS